MPCICHPSSRQPLVFQFSLNVQNTSGSLIPKHHENLIKGVILREFSTSTSQLLPGWLMQEKLLFILKFLPSLFPCSQRASQTISDPLLEKYNLSAIMCLQNPVHFCSTAHHSEPEQEHSISSYWSCSCVLQYILHSASKIRHQSKCRSCLGCICFFISQVKGTSSTLAS